MRTVIFDGNNCVWRVANVLPILTTPKGETVQVIYGFLRLLRTALERFEAQRAIVCWDCGYPKYRVSLDPLYKSRRLKGHKEATKKEKRQRSDVLRQLSVLQEILPYLGVVQLSHKNTEADDFIGVTCYRIAGLGKKIVVSGDKDMLQLVRPGVRLFMPNKETLYTYKNFEKKVKFTPEQWRDYRALVGDTGDDIPNAFPGMGEKTARKLVIEYTSSARTALQNMYRHPGDVAKRGKKFKKFLEGEVWDRIDLNLRLMDLKRVHNRKKLASIVHAEVENTERCQPTQVKNILVAKRFISLLAQFASWIQPFKELNV